MSTAALFIDLPPRCRLTQTGAAIRAVTRVLRLAAECNVLRHGVFSMQLLIGGMRSKSPLDLRVEACGLVRG